MNFSDPPLSPLTKKTIARFINNFKKSSLQARLVNAAYQTLGRGSNSLPEDLENQILRTLRNSPITSKDSMSILEIALAMQFRCLISFCLRQINDGRNNFGFSRLDNHRFNVWVYLKEHEDINKIEDEFFTPLYEIYENNVHTTPNEHKMELSVCEDINDKTILNFVHSHGPQISQLDLFLSDLDYPGTFKNILECANNLKYLRIHWMNLTDNNIKDICQHKKINSLELEKLENNNTLHFDGSKTLEYLEIHRADLLQSLHLHHLEGLKRVTITACKNLKRIYIDEYSSPDKLLITGCHNLISIESAENIPSTHKHIKNCPNLNEDFLF